MMGQSETKLIHENHWIQPDDMVRLTFPLADELFVSDWERYAQEAQTKGVVNALAQRLKQLSFPIQQGMSENPEYQQVTRKGFDCNGMVSARGVIMKEPNEVRLFFYQTDGGRIPVIEVKHRNDFETFVRAFAHRNEPVQIPASMGACMIKGYNNWDRVERYKNKMGLAFNFNKMKEAKEHYRDVFLIITEAPYSGVPASVLGLSEDDWLRLSTKIRLGHEATHYLTLRCFGSAKNHLLDELIADYRGIVHALGYFRSDWLLTFFGINEDLTFRTGGRMVNYIKQDELTDEGFKEVVEVIKKAALYLEKRGIEDKNIYSKEGQQQLLLKLVRSNLNSIAQGNVI